jgi:hypothetical protein
VKALGLHLSLLTLRRNDPVLRAAGEQGVDAAVLAPMAWVMRYRAPADAPTAGDRLLVVNLDAVVVSDIGSEPLLASPSRVGWQMIWNSDDPQVGGTGALALEHLEGWRLPGMSAWLLAG